MVVFSSISHSHPLPLISPFPVCSSPLFFFPSLAFRSSPSRRRPLSARRKGCCGALLALPQACAAAHITSSFGSALRLLFTIAPSLTLII